MAPVALYRLLSFALALSAVSAQTQTSVSTPTTAPASTPTPPPTSAAGLPPGITGTFPSVPLVSKHFSYPGGLPYQSDNETGLIRGTQFGYNLCNSTTEGQTSKCQTAFMNNITDFCLWGPPVANGTVGDYEADMVAYCTVPGRGTRLIPEGALQGVQWITTPDYIEITGFIDQTKIDMNAQDSGGELDPHGADLRGNPLGGLFFSTAFTGQWEQVIQWHSFMGGNQFCQKLCNPASPNAASLCYNIYDRIGCAYNIPAAPINGTFMSCLGEDQLPPGVYVTNGVTMTYTQPGENTAITMPYTPYLPPSSSCTTYTSSQIYSLIATVGVTSTAPGSSATGKSQPTGSSSGATTLTVSGVSILGAVLSAFFLS